MAEVASAGPSVDLDDVRGWTGHRLDEVSGGAVGRIEGVFVDEPGGMAAWLLARMGRFGHYTLVPVRDAVEGVGHVWVPYTRDQIRRAPRVEANDPIDVAAERGLLAHYGIVPDAGRSAELGRLGEDSVSARPA